MSQTTGVTISSATVSDVSDSTFSHYISDVYAIVVLLGALYGVLTVLSALSVHALTQHRGSTRITIIVLCLTILILFTSTTVYVVVFALASQTQFLSLVNMHGMFLWNAEDPMDRPHGLVQDHQYLRGCASDVALTINMTLGDAIVCWRACVIWNGNRAVQALCGIFVLATFAVGATDTTYGCRPMVHPPMMTVSTLIHQGTIYQGVPICIAACVLSLCTNIFATLLVGYKAWESKRRLRGYLVAGSQVEKILALLIESGAVYCAIWTAIVAYQAIQYRSASLRPASAVEASFEHVFKVVFTGTLMPLIAIYPMIIIVLVALNRSHIEKGLSQHLQSVPTPHIAVTANTMVTGEAASYQRSEALVIGWNEQGLRQGEGAEDASKPIGREDV